ncbi:unnamed protein product [Diabrotica balteata]|uniref:Circadian clock-controlled protein n=1 Tax=Diabrotica balteata TaxID=107213 RepID=A0A9N9TEN7_DIABA|nr:unnamed protein product [Diabrotica balteata]
MAPYLKPCHKKHNFSACAMESAKYAIPFLLAGDRNLGLPSFSPMEIPLIEVRGSGDFKVTLKNIKVYGLENVKPLVIDVDFEKRKAHVLSTIPTLIITAEYKVEGHILIFALNGDGPANLTLSDGIYTYDFEWTLEKRHGEQHAKIVKSNFDYKLKHVKYYFKDVIKGDRLLSDRINQVLNENWEVVDEDLRDSVRQTLLIIHDDLFAKVFTRIPIRFLFLDD